MIYPVFSIRDVKTAFMAPMVEINDRAAIRNFSRIINSETGLINYSPSDFDLYLIGHFDDQSGKLESIDPVQFIVAGRDLVGVKDA